MLERSVEDYLRDRVRATGGTIRKVVWPGHRGAPDRLAGWAATSRAAFVETKRPSGRGPAAHQQREHERLRALGFDVRTIHCRAHVDAFIEEMTR